MGSSVAFFVWLNHVDNMCTTSLCGLYIHADVRDALVALYSHAR